MRVVWSFRPGVRVFAGSAEAWHPRDVGTLLRFLQPLQRLATAGVAVLVLHHPRKKALTARLGAAKHHEILLDWPVGPDKPSTTQLYLWLNRAWETKRVRRQGQGRKNDPYRYRLEDEDDKYRDWGELPPLKNVDFLMG